MTDSVDKKDSRGNLKITPEVKDEVLDAVELWRKTRRRKPTQAEVISEALGLLAERLRQGDNIGRKSEGEAAKTFRPQNRIWHERLELVLNDPDEALGIQKNLEWAEKTVRGKDLTAHRKTGS